MRKSERSKACHFKPSIMREILERDKWCIFCGTPHNLTIAHFISRAKGGLGIKENGGAVCMRCHHQLDHTDKRQAMLSQFRDYLYSHYPNFQDEERVYKKWSEH